MGRFTQQDPACDGFNWYVYCSNNPVNLIDPFGLASYVFYIGEFEDETADIKQELVNAGESLENIHVIQVNSKAEFDEAWNNMGTVTDEDGNTHQEEINNVVIDMHGNEDLIGGDGIKIYATNIEDLDKKKLNGNLVLLPCNVGHLDYSNSNPANSFAKKVSGALVIAADGTVYPDNPSKKFPNGNFISKNDKFFRDIIEKSGNPDIERDNAGWVVYRDHGSFVPDSFCISSSCVPN